MTREKITIKIASSADADLCATLMNTIAPQTNFLARGTDDGLLQADELSQTFLAESGHDTVFLAFQNRVPVGYLISTVGAYIRLSAATRISMAVEASATGCGVGDTLLRACEIWARDNGIVRIELIVMITNDPAIRLYEKHGYELEGTRRRSIRVNDVDLDQFLMAKLLY